MRTLAHGLLLSWSMVLLCVLCGCRARNLGLPRVALSESSPDGEAVAFVRNHMSIDPPAQSIWLLEGTKYIKLRRLAEDIDWCNVIRWSADGSTVVFLIQDARLLVVDRASARIVGDTWLTEDDDYPTRRMAANLRVSPDGRNVEFGDCARSRHDLFGAEKCEERVVQIR